MRSLRLFLLTWLISIPAVFGEEVRQDPASDAGVVQERIREEGEAQGQPERRAPEIDVPPPAAPPSAVPEVRFVVSAIQLQGNTVFPTATFASLIAAYEQREVTVQELQVLAEAIQQVYRQRGYVTTVAFLSPQRIEAGRVTIQIVEGRLGRTLLEGQRHFSARRLLRYWPFAQGDLLQYGRLRRALARLNDHPDRQVQALLRPGAAVGETDVILKVTDRLPVHLGGQWDRQGTQSIGRLRYGASFGHNNLLGLDDRGVLAGVFGNRFGALFTQYTLPLTRYGTAAIAGWSYSQTSPKRHFKPFGINGISQTFWLALSQALVETEQLFLQGQLRLDVKESKTKQLGGTSQRDRLRAIRLEPSLRLTDVWGSWVVEQETAFGIKGLGATSENNPVASRPGTKPDFLKIGFVVHRLHRLPWHTQLSLKLETQLATSKLAPQEELYLGGAQSIRGYPEGDYLADQGVIARGEWLIPCRFLPDTWRLPGTGTPVGEQLMVLGFLDRGYGRLRAITGTERSTRNLTGLGLGAQFRIANSLVARIEWGFSVGDRPLTDDSSSILHFSFRSDL
ncbi:MAG: ShlB/FhaC/HecB family hemolysin secretion/activation protein [Candidatus Omnitrophica bacterium]|nr:ShlB/FhaC/HecB family hemolysin secretion/activation protein [Candidatus Omnitrophota bacterium]